MGLHCTGIAVALKMLDKRIHLPFAYMEPGGKMSHGISDLAAVGDHFVEVNEKVYIVGVLEANAGFSQPVKQFPVEFQYFKYGHVLKNL
jgi:hypothetical protein